MRVANESAMHVSTVKEVLSTVWKVALQDLREKGTFKVYGICDLEVKELQERKELTRKRSAHELNIKARPARKKVHAKVNKELTQLVMDE